METLFTYITTSSSDDPIFWGVLIVILLFSLPRLTPVLASLSAFQNRQLTSVHRCLDSKVEMALETKAALEDLREALYFKSTIGIYAEKAFRAALLKLHTSTSSKITWRSIRKAQNYLVEEDGDIVVKFTRLHHFGYYFSFLSMVFLFLFFLGSIFTLIGKPQVTTLHILGLVISPLFATLYATDYYSFKVAKDIELYLRK